MEKFRDILGERPLTVVVTNLAGVAAVSLAEIEVYLKILVLILSTVISLLTLAERWRAITKNKRNKRKKT